MADLEWSTVTALDAALTTTAVPAAARTLFLAEANALRPSAFDGEDGPRFALARAYLAAHRGRQLLEAGTGATGPLVSKSMGGLAKSYAAPSSADPDDLDLTRWGRAYRLLCRTSPNSRLGAR